MKKNILFVFILLVVLNIFLISFWNKKSDVNVDLIEISHQKIKKPLYFNDHLEIVVKQESELIKYVEEYKIKNLVYSIDWGQEFILLTHPYAISFCTYNTGNRHNRLYPLDIIYSNKNSPEIYVYKVRGREFVTWEAIGYNKKIQFESN